MRSYVLRAAAGKSINEEIQANSATGLLWTSFKIQPVIKDGKISQLVAEGHDISEQRYLREESRAAQQRMQGMLDCMKAMVDILNTKGRVSLINSPLCWSRTWSSKMYSVCNYGNVPGLRKIIRHKPTYKDMLKRPLLEVPHWVIF